MVTTEVLVRTIKALGLTMFTVLHFMVNTVEHDRHGELGEHDATDDKLLVGDMQEW